MDESRGQKGGHNDLKRAMLISRKELEKLKAFAEEQELKDLENRVKKAQIKTFLKISPIIITGTILKTLSGSAHNEATSPLILPKSSEEDYKKQVFLTPDKNNNFIEVNIKTSEFTKTRVNVNNTNLENLLNNHKTIKKKTTHVEVIEIDQTKIPIKETTKNDTLDLDKLKNKEIVSQYEEKLKDARSSLKDLMYEYKVIEEMSKTTNTSKELEELLDRLNALIKKLDELKQKLSLDISDTYDLNYIKDLASAYITSFENKEIIDEIKDSSLYILISSKVTELKQEEELLAMKLEDRKEELKMDEYHINEMKDKFDDYQNFNVQLMKLQAEQDILVKDLKEKIASSVTVQERVEVTTRLLNTQALNLNRLLRPQLLLRSPRSARRMATATASYLRFMRNVLRPRRETHHYRVFEVTDYSKEIEYSIQELDRGLDLIKKSSSELKRMLNDFERDYKDYLDNKEVKELLSNLEEVYSSLKEKEDDLLRIKKEQEKNLEESKAKTAYVKRYEQID